MQNIPFGNTTFFYTCVASVTNIDAGPESEVDNGVPALVGS